MVEVKFGVSVNYTFVYRNLPVNSRGYYNFQ